MRLNFRPGAAVATALLAFTTMAGCGSDDSSGSTAADGSCSKPTTLRTSLVPLYPLIKVGTDSGIFAKHCLAVVDTPATSPVAAIPAIVGGSVDLTLLPLYNVLTTLNQKIPITIVAPGAAIPDDAASLPPEKVDAAGVFAPKGSTITSPKDLAGKTVAVPGLGTSIQLGTMAAVIADGGDPSGIQWVQLDSATEVQQLDAGQVDAAAVAVPFATQLAAAGNPRITSPTLALYGPGLAYTPWVTTTKDFEANQDAFKRFREAILEVQQYSMDHPDQYQQAQSDSTKVPLDALKAGPGFWFATDISSDDVSTFADKLTEQGLIEEVPDLTDVVATYK